MLSLSQVSDIYLLVSFVYVYRICPNLKHVLFEVLLLFLAITEPLQNQLTEVWEIDQTFPENTRTD